MHLQGRGEAEAAESRLLDLAGQPVAVCKSPHGGKCKHSMTDCGEVKSTEVANFIQNTEILLKTCFLELSQFIYETSEIH